MNLESTTNIRLGCLHYLHSKNYGAAFFQNPFRGPPEWPDMPITGAWMNNTLQTSWKGFSLSTGAQQRLDLLGKCPENQMHPMLITSHHHHIRHHHCLRSQHFSDPCPCSSSSSPSSSSSKQAAKNTSPTSPTSCASSADHLGSLHTGLFVPHTTGKASARTRQKNREKTDLGCGTLKSICGTLKSMTIELPCFKEWSYHGKKQQQQHIFLGKTWEKQLCLVIACTSLARIVMFTRVKWSIANEQFVRIESQKKRCQMPCAKCNMPKVTQANQKPAS